MQERTHFNENNYAALQDYIYLFTVDLARIPFKHDCKMYEVKEPGYGLSWLKAYIHAFSTPMNGKLSSAFIKQIHKGAMSFKQNTCHPGVYKTRSNNIPIYPYAMNEGDVLAYSASIKGVEEYIRYWFSPESPQVHTIGYSLKEDHTTCAALMSGMALIEVEQGKRLPARIVDVESVMEIGKTKFFDINYQWLIDSMPEIDDENVQSKTAEIMDKLVNDYNVEIQLAHSDEEKIRVIVTYIQRIDQLHPFLDGNVRTCYILMNKLLRDNQLSLSLLMNANRFDCCSIDELIDMVKQGQIHFQQLVNHVDGPLIFKAPKEFHSSMQSLTCPKDQISGIEKSLINSFIETVLLQKQEKKLEMNSNRLYSIEISVSAKKLLHELDQLTIKGKIDDRITSKINSGEYGVALRLACRFASDVSVIEKILDFATDLSIDVNETSSNKKAATDWIKLNPNLGSDEMNQIEMRLTSLSGTLGIIK